MIGVPERNVQVRFRIEVWQEAVLLYSASTQEISFPVTTDLRYCAEELRLPLETVAYLVTMPNLEKTFKAKPPLRVKVLPASPLALATAN